MKVCLSLAALVAWSGGALACTQPPGPTTFSPGEGTEAVTRATIANGTVITAWFDDATTRYAHGVLGDAIEAGSLHVAVDASAIGGDCTTASIDLDLSHVFEDLAPRLADLNADGTPEIITVRSNSEAGGQLAIYGIGASNEPELVATTPYIGLRNRWLAPAGTGDFDGDGRVEIAYVETPHLGKTLLFWRLEDGELEYVSGLRGVTNHRIGEDFISSTTRTCDGKTEVVLASADWRKTIAVSLEGTEPTWAELGSWDGLDGLKASAACE